MALLQYLSSGEEGWEQAEARDIDLVSNLTSFYDLNITAVQTKAQSGQEGAECCIVFAEEGIFRLYLQENRECTLTLLRVWEYLQAEGFSRLAALQPTSGGDIAISLDDRLAYLAEELEGRPAELAVQRDAVEIGRCLGELHVLSQDVLPVLQGVLGGTMLLKPSLNAQREDLDLFHTMARHRLYPTGFDLLFVRIYDGAARLADQSLRLLSGFPLEELENDSRWAGLLLGSCQGRTFRVNDEGIPRLPCLNRITWGLYLWDLVTLLDSVGRYTDWSTAAAHRVLDFYRGVRCLHPGEMELMYGLSMFPKEIWEIGYDYYKGRRQQGEPEAAKILRQAWEKTIRRSEYWRLLLGDELEYENSH